MMQMSSVCSELVVLLNRARFLSLCAFKKYVNLGKALYSTPLTFIIDLIVELDVEMQHKFSRIYKKRCGGFTLIELMITVVIIGILAAIVYPSYREYVYKSRRSDGKVGLLQLQLAQEKYRANCIQYATGIDTATYSCSSTLGTTDDGNHDLLVKKNTSPDGYYTLSISPLPSSTVLAQTTYSLTATATGVQLGDSQCRKLVINQDGTKTSTDSAGNTSTGCW